MTVRALIIWLVIVALFACGVVISDTTRDWTAVGDDDMVGRATGYVMAVSRDSTLIVAASNDSTGFNPIPGVTVYGPDILPTPAIPGELETFTLTDLAPGIWFASVKAFDEVPNYALLGNIARFEVADYIPPAAILNLN